MDNDPKSYRVPILSLKNVLDDESDKKNVTPKKETKETSSETVPVQYIEESPEILEEDVLSSVITPTVKEEFVLQEKSVDIPKENVIVIEEEDKKTPILSEENKLTEVDSTKKTIEQPSEEKQVIEKTRNEKLNQKDISIQEPSNTVLHLSRHVTINKAEPGVQDIPIKKPDVKVKNIPSVSLKEKMDIPETIASKPILEEKNTVPEKFKKDGKKEIQPLEKEKDFSVQNEKQVIPKQVLDKKISEIKTPIPINEKANTQSIEEPLHQEDELDIAIKNEAQIEHSDTKDESESIFTLIKKSLTTKANTETPGIETVPTSEPEKITEEPEVQKTPPSKPKIKLPKVPVPDPLDIWERDAAKPRVPYSKKSSEPKPPAVTKSVTKVEPKDVPLLTEKETRKEISETKTSANTKKNIIEGSTLTSQEKNFVSKKPQSVSKTDDDILNSTTQIPLQKIPAGVSNLSSLRDRILKENANQANIEKNSEQANLTSDRQNLNPETIIPTTSQNKRPRPASKHAQAVADIADRLHDMGENVVNTDSNTSTTIKQTNSAPKETNESSFSHTTIPGALEEDIPKPLYKALESSVPMMRTFRQDVEQAVNHNRTSVIDIVSAEEKRRGNEEMIRRAPQQTISSWSYVFIGASMVLIIGALAIGAFLFFRFMTNSPSDIIPERVPINDSISYDLTNQTKNEIMSGLVGVRNAIHSNQGSITEVQITEQKKTEGTDTMKISFVTTSSFLQKIETHTPGNLIRSLSDTMLLGIHELQKNEPFIVFSTATYDSAYSGMFEWEKDINKDLSPLFGIYLETTSAAEYMLLSKNNATSTISASSTDSIRNEQQILNKPHSLVFEDVFVSNIPTRCLKNTSDETVLMWTMPDKATIIITTNEKTMQALLEFMTARTF